MSDSKSAPHRLLLVDDTQLNLDLLQDALDGLGYELITATNGQDAITLTREHRPSLILLDINMPGIDGFETCRRLKADPDTADTAVIFLSARTEVADKVEGLSLGAVDYIAKPFMLDEVIARVAAHLKSHDRMRDMRDTVERLNQELDAQTDGGVPTVKQVARLIEGGESEVCEFKSTVRRNLHSGKNDKAIEKAWLKTVVAFMNSLGGTLLVGVDDEGTILGLEADQFANDDRALLHVNNLIKKHIGPEYAPFISFGTVDMGTASVLAVACSRAGPPAYFRTEDDDDVFIRVGPGSRRLTSRQAMEYFAAREAQSSNEG
jgi:DNA-binding response OmpR family regulator